MNESPQSSSAQAVVPVEPQTSAEPQPAVAPVPLAKRIYRSFEKWFAVVIIALMALLPTLEVLLRPFRTTIPGSLLYTQHLTLWIGFVGALLATAQEKHLSLATGDFIPKGLGRDLAKVYIAAMSAAVAGLLAVAAWTMVKADSISVSRVLPGGVPEWWSELIMPFALGAMALRFLYRAGDKWWARGAAAALAIAVSALGMLIKSPENLLWPMGLSILVGVGLGAPVFVGMAGLAMLLFYADGTSIAAVPTETFRLVLSSSLPAIPLLTAAGYVLAEGGASRRLLRFSQSLLGWMPGGLTVIVVFVCALFTTFTGGSGVTILALGGLVFPMLISQKYPEGFSLGLVTSSGSLGLLFPPSLPVILYAVVAGASVRDLFLAGFVPGMLLVLMVAGYGLIVGLTKKTPRQPFSIKEVLASGWAAKWELAIPAVVVGSIVTGVATVVESAGLALVTAVVSQSFIFKDLHWRRELPQTLARGATLVGAVIILLGVAMGLTSYLVDAEIPAAVLAWTKQHIHSPTVFLLALNGVLLVLGSVLEIYSAIIILAPLLAPMATAYGIDPLHLGVVFLANLELGFLFPPMGLNLILSSSRFNQPLTRLYKVALPFLLIMAVGVLLATYVPAMTTGVLEWVNAKGAAAGAVQP